MAQQLAMAWSEWARHDAVALAALVRSGAATPRALAAQAAAAAERLNPALAAVLEIFADVRANPNTDGPARDGGLYGVPMLLKDLGSGLKGRTQQGGSKLTRSYVVPETDPTIANFLAAGLVPLGRSTTPEFGLTFDTATDIDALRVTRNPWNPAHTPGGSSGGSAAAVAAGIVPVAMSGDGGGSTRIPAAFCGLIGLKASRGRVPRPHFQSEYMVRFSADGVLTRTVRDTAAVYETLTHVPKGGSFIAMGPPQRSYLTAVESDPARLRIGLTTGMWGRATATDPIVADRIRAVGRAMEALGHTVEEVADNDICDWEILWRAYTTAWVGNTVGLADRARALGIEPQNLASHLTPMTYRHYLAAQRYGAADILRMMADNNTVTRQFGRVMERYDLLLTPTLAIRVPEANGPYSLLRDEDLDTWVARLSDACRYTMPGNETGLPGISVPTGLDPAGLPIGAQFYASWGEEALLMQVAAQLERAHPAWFNQTPPIHVTNA
ncbi:MAG: amidase [Acetobacteraceae bacterium]|nr:amidase [Acetobacteraceae bacterium]